MAARTSELLVTTTAAASIPSAVSSNQAELLATAAALAPIQATVHSVPAEELSVNASTTTTHYFLMAWKDVDCGPLTFRYWRVSGSQDPTGTQYSGAKCGVTPISGAFAIKEWIV